MNRRGSGVVVVVVAAAVAVVVAVAAVAPAVHQTKLKRAAREQRNKYKPRTKQEQHLPIRQAGRPAD